MKISDIRQDYKSEKLSRKDLDNSPIAQFQKWFNQAVDSKLQDPNAMSIATCVDNQPHSRIVLLKGIHNNEFRFFTNYSSSNPCTSHWFY